MRARKKDRYRSRNIKKTEIEGGRRRNGEGAKEKARN